MKPLSFFCLPSFCPAPVPLFWFLPIKNPAIVAGRIIVIIAFFSCALGHSTVVSVRGESWYCPRAWPRQSVRRRSELPRPLHLTHHAFNMPCRHLSLRSCFDGLLPRKRVQGFVLTTSWNQQNVNCYNNTWFRLVINDGIHEKLWYRMHDFVGLFLWAVGAKRYFFEML